MTPQQKLGLAVAGLMDESCAKDIVNGMMSRAKDGDIDAVRMLVALSQAAPGPAGCDHDQSKWKEDLSTMGGGPSRAVCGCGTLLVDGVPQEG